MRFPTVNAESIAFVAYGNLWIASPDGRNATPLTQDPGQVFSPHFSPDGRSIAFTWKREGGSDVYVISSTGGAPTRLTHGPTLDSYDNIVTGWSADGAKILFLSVRQSPFYHQYETFAVSATGGLATRLMPGHSGLSSFSPDGKAIAFDRTFRNLAGDRWKHYVGGQAPDIFIYDFTKASLQKVTEWEGIDTAPMWSGRRIYFLSDRGSERRANLWMTDLDTKNTRQLTHFSDYDIDIPSIGPGGIAFQQGGRLFRFDLSSERLQEIAVVMPASANRAPREVTAARFINRNDFGLASGNIAIFSARGDLFAVAADGTARNLTHTRNSTENFPAISPDGRTLAFVTDANGEEQIATMPASGGSARVLTRFKAGHFYAPRWSSDGTQIAIADASHGLWLIDTKRARVKRIALDPYAEIRDARFSHNGKWLAYSTMRPSQIRAIHLYDLVSGADTVVSSAAEDDHDPLFSEDDRTLYFLSKRHELAIVSDRDREGTLASLKSETLFSVSLQPGSQLTGLTAAAVEVPVAAQGEIADLAEHCGTIFYRTKPASGIGGDLPGESSALHAFDISASKDRVLAENVDAYSLSADANSALVRRGRSWEIIANTADGSAPLAIKLDALLMTVDARAEAQEMVRQAWRLNRDLFWDTAMNGVDWPAVRDRYMRLAKQAGSHEDLIYLIGEMQGELATSHMFVGGGDRGDPRASVDTALLGVDFELDRDCARYRLSHVYRGDPSRTRFRAPLGNPSFDVRDGDYLLAVDEQSANVEIDPYALLLGKQGSVNVTLSHACGGKPFSVRVETVEDESEIRKLDWMARNRMKVDQLSKGTLGYLYLSDFNALGAEDFFRQFYSQTEREGLVIDIRSNTGGFTSQWVLDVLGRAPAGEFINRNQAVTTLPGALPPRKLVVLTNMFSMSDGDQFPYFFKERRMGKVVGQRTWGGVRGVKGTWPLMDGTFITVPKDALRSPSGELIIENHGAAPDITIDMTPADIAAGRDPQLEEAVKLLSPPP